MAQSHTGDHEELLEIQSLISDTQDIGSHLAGSNIPELLAAEKHLTKLLQSNKEMLVILTDISENMGSARLQRNLSRLLKKFYVDLFEEAVSNLEKSTANLLRSRNARHRISKSIAGRLEHGKDDSSSDDDPNSKRPVYRKSLAEVEIWIGNQRAFSEPFLSSERDGTKHKSLNARDNDSADISESYESDIQDRKPLHELPHISRMENFVFKRAAFQKLLTNLQLFERVNFSCYVHQSWLDRGKCYMQQVSAYPWDWWPFDGPKSQLDHGMHCGKELSEDTSPKAAFQLQRLLHLRPFPSETNHLCLNRRRSQHPPKQTLVHFLSSLYTSFSWPLSPAISSTLPAPNVQPTSSSSSSPPTGPVALPATAANPSSSSTVADQQSTHVIPIAPDDRLLVLLGVQGTRTTLDIEQLDVKKKADGQPPDDGVFFNDLVNAYKNMRGRLRLWFLLNKIRRNRVIVGETAIPHDPDYEYDNSPTPPAEMPPIPEHEFRSSLFPCSEPCWWSPFHDCIEPSTENHALKLIPKKKSL
ncbi:uncharacterized protein Z518_10784 [Rhinocladiella mackenziei CBS 650.93]|uniref:Uncharacterized protein n=1 Tax=Rhinocladiella mackenziei CBS 650.93 TaxID=1442369 RepID=A0A0D2FCN9_9EURO|nr:uncharacterized protein Z518_10784 [Rhinocladiella mackenziei CBS 650.93]KIW99856.1 hypothetical protein Z518_10784 [Rhinocladiella mackenziei CBS 650.93]